MLFWCYLGERENSENKMPVKNTNYTVMQAAMSGCFCAPLCVRPTGHVAGHAVYTQVSAISLCYWWG